ncbi:MAG TPA: pyruvate, phosphate dikinase [Longimicrobiales bacterium]|nr:pyruvate, phosphate dikinase [Longimicrobiales bacterium]
MTKRVYHFGGGVAEAGREDKALLGGKGANLAEMTRIGVPVPPGFVITTETCIEYLRVGSIPEGLDREVREHLARLEAETERTFGGGDSPLLVSVRSGAAISMPGMMDTILNLGLNDETVEALARESSDRRFAFDSYRRFIQMYGNVVLGIASKRFDEGFEATKRARGATHDTDVDAEALAELVVDYKSLVREATGTDFPADPRAQLEGAIAAVFRSWNTERASHYRRVNRIPDDMGTAVNVVAMVYGNMGDDSGTGVAFTRNPNSGEPNFFGEFLVNAQGEDVVAGIRDPLSIDDMATALPGAYAELREVASTLERHYRDMQDLEFTVERGRLYLLQTRTGKRAAAAAVRIAVDMVDEDLIDAHTALMRVDPKQLDQLLHPGVDPDADASVLATGLPASPGAAAGAVVFDPDEAAARGLAGEDVILVRTETSPDDYHGMVAARAIVTARGGMTSHAAVVARGMGKCCIVGAQEIAVDMANEFFSTDVRRVAKGEWITVDGTTGRVLEGRVRTVEPELTDDFHRLMAWADDARRLGVRANADSPADAAKARELGAEGIGLCRTEHMFFEGDRLTAMREMILARDEAARTAALDRLLPMQIEDFVGIFRAMDGLPVTIRLLDPPLHEFLPHDDDQIADLARETKLAESEVRRAIERHHESNPMLGHRGVRLGYTFPEITRMQARAIIEAALQAADDGVDVRPEIMLPLVGSRGELDAQTAVVREVAERVMEERGRRIAYLVGTMIELPRAALIAGAIAEQAEFFSFGTNDLTQTTLGISRDDSASFLPHYVDQGVYADDPFQVLDRDGVGRLIGLAVREGRGTCPHLKVGVCGEHGGDPSSVEFFHDTGLDYVSCSPYRVPVARLAAARAALTAGSRDSDVAGTPAAPMPAPSGPTTYGRRRTDLPGYTYDPHGAAPPTTERLPNPAPAKPAS